MTTDSTNLHGAEAICESAKKLIADAESAGFNARLMGSVAVRIACMPALASFDELRRPPKDIDIVIRHDRIVAFARFLKEHGWLEGDRGLALTEGGKFTVRHRNTGLTLDIYGSRLRFNQDLDVTDALTTQGPALPLAELLLLKIQIDNKSSEDWIDLALLLAAHNISLGSATPPPGIDRDRLVAVLGSWRWRQSVRVATDCFSEDLARSLGLGETLEKRARSGMAALRTLASDGDTFLSVLLSPIRQMFFAYSRPVDEASSRDGSERELNAGGAGARPTGSAAPDRVSGDTYLLGLAVICQHVKHAYDNDREVFCDYEPFPAMSFWRLIRSRLRTNRIARLPWFVVVLTLAASFVLCSLVGWPKNELVVIFEAAGVVLLALTSFHYAKEVVDHAKGGHLRRGGAENTSAPRSDTPEWRAVRLSVLWTSSLLPVLAALCFYIWHIANVASFHTEDGSAARYFDLKAAWTWVYLGYLAFLSASYVMFCIIDWYVAGQSNQPGKTRDYSILFWLVDWPSAVSFSLLLLMVIVFNLPLSKVGLPYQIHPNVVGGAATLQILMSCTAYSLVVVGIPQHMFVRHFATVGAPQVQAAAGMGAGTAGATSGRGETARFVSEIEARPATGPVVGATVVPQAAADGQKAERSLPGP